MLNLKFTRFIRRFGFHREHVFGAIFVFTSFVYIFYLLSSRRPAMTPAYISNRDKPQQKLFNYLDTAHQKVFQNIQNGVNQGKQFIANHINSSNNLLDSVKNAFKPQESMGVTRRQLNYLSLFQMKWEDLRTLIKNQTAVHYLHQKAVESHSKWTEVWNRTTSTRCDCGSKINDSCRCCDRLNVWPLGLLNSACVTLFYEPMIHLLTVTINYNGVQIMRATKTLKLMQDEDVIEVVLFCSTPSEESPGELANMPQVCANFTKLNYRRGKLTEQGSMSELHGCVNVEVKLQNEMIGFYPLGCFISKHGRKRRKSSLFVKSRNES